MAQTAQLRRIDDIENEAQRIFSLQRQAYLRDLRRDAVIDFR